jgi:hypothetical protein
VCVTKRWELAKCVRRAGEVLRWLRGCPNLQYTYSSPCAGVVGRVRGVWSGVSEWQIVRVRVEGVDSREISLMMQLNGTARQLIWKLCLYSLITTSNSLNQAFTCRENVPRAGIPLSVFAVASTRLVLLFLTSIRLSRVSLLKGVFKAVKKNLKSNDVGFPL